MKIHPENARLFDEFLRHFALRSTEQGVRSFKWGIHRFMVWLGPRQILLIKRHDLTLYVEDLTRDGLKTSTMNQYLSALLAFWRYYEDMERTPFPGRLFPKVPVRDRVSYPPVTEEQFEMLMDALPPSMPVHARERCAFSLMFATGLRINELLSINLTDLDLLGKCVYVKSEKRKNHYRTVYWDETTHRELKAWIRVRADVLKMSGHPSQPALFVNMATNNLGIQLDDANLQRSFRNARTRARLPSNLVCHSLRHGFATRAHSRKVDVFHISTMLGHAKLATTQVYLHANNAEVEQAYRSAFGGGKVNPDYEEYDETQETKTEFHAGGHRKDARGGKEGLASAPIDYARRSGKTRSHAPKATRETAAVLGGKTCREVIPT